MKIFKTFETWNDNEIDNSLFSSGRAKYNPTVSGGIIRYKTGNVEPYYFAEITKKGDKFICKIYKKKSDGTEKRIRNKIKKNLKLAHNYVREFLNQKLRSKSKGKKDSERIMSDGPKRRDIPFNTQTASPKRRDIPFDTQPYIAPPKSKTIIRKFY